MDITQEIEDDFDYLSKTRNLEIDTPRTKMLQEEILDKFTKGTDIQTRVVIMNKGAAEAAFVYPDGTVFISQSLLNKLDSLDEVAAVLAHEVKHMILKTSSKVREARTGAKLEHGERNSAQLWNCWTKGIWKTFIVRIMIITKRMHNF